MGGGKRKLIPTVRDKKKPIATETHRHRHCHRLMPVVQGVQITHGSPCLVLVQTYTKFGRLQNLPDTQQSKRFLTEPVTAVPARDGATGIP